MLVTTVGGVTHEQPDYPCNTEGVMWSSGVPSEAARPLLDRAGHMRATRTRPYIHYPGMTEPLDWGLKPSDDLSASAIRSGSYAWTGSLSKAGRHRMQAAIAAMAHHPTLHSLWRELTVR